MPAEHPANLLHTPLATYRQRRLQNNVPLDQLQPTSRILAAAVSPMIGAASINSLQPWSDRSAALLKPRVPHKPLDHW
jgi:hypothetical protein